MGLKSLPAKSPHDWDLCQSVGAATGTPEPSTRARVLVVDDEAPIRELLGLYLRSQGHGCAEAETAQEAFDLIRSSSFDVVLTDIRMPQTDGLELLRGIKAFDDTLAVIMISGVNEICDVITAMKMGADDYFVKPLNFESISIGIGRAMEKRESKLKIRQYQKNLENIVAMRTGQDHRLFMNVIESLIYSLEARDVYTMGHSQRVTWLALQLAQTMDLGVHDLEVLWLGAALHDLGKIGIRESVLLKPGPLSIEEYDHIKTHPDIGARILRPLHEFNEIIPIVLHHHERYDGGGYPTGLRGEEIPLAARIVSVADAYDAMTSARPYRGPLTADEATSRLRKDAGSQFDAHMVNLFLPLAEDKNLHETLHSPLWKSKHGRPEDDTLASWCSSEAPADPLKPVYSH